MVFWTYKYLQEIKKNQRLSKKDLEELQKKRLKKIILHAYHTVPYYHYLFKINKLHPEMIKKTEDIEKIPITTKKDLVNAGQKNIISTSTNLKKCSLEQTSGSSGTSLFVARSQKTKHYELALVLNAMFECGLKMHDKLLTIEDPRHIKNNNPSLINRLGLLKEKKISLFETPKTLLNTIQETKPDVIYAHPSSMYLISELMKNNAATLNKKPKFVISTSEIVYPKQKKGIEEQFNCPLYDQYGSTEFPRIAWQCKESEHMHINSESHLLEFIKNNKPVKKGKGLITITSLYNYGMPFLRYSLNDISEPVEKECDCGLNLPLMKSIEGRIDDFLVDKNGKAISPKIFCYELDEIKTINEFFLLQKEAGKATLYIEKKSAFKQQDLDIALKRIYDWTEKKILIKTVFKKKVPAENKKLRRITSEVSAEF